MRVESRTPLHGGSISARTRGASIRGNTSPGSKVVRGGIRYPSSPKYGETRSPPPSALFAPPRLPVGRQGGAFSLLLSTLPTKNGFPLPQPYFCEPSAMVLLYRYTRCLREAARFALRGMCYSHTRAGDNITAKIGRGVRASNSLRS